MRFALVVAGIVSASPVAAEAELAPAILACWNPPASVSGGDWRYMATFDVVIDRAGTVEDATVVEFTPNNEEGRDGVQSFVRAMQRCGPFDVAQGTHRVTLTISPSEPIDPFKGR